MNTKVTIPLISEIKEDKKYETKTYKIPYGAAYERHKAEIKLKMFKDGSKEEFSQFILDFKCYASRLGLNTAALNLEGLESLYYGAAINQWQVACYVLDLEDQLINGRRRRTENQLHQQWKRKPQRDLRVNRKEYVYPTN